MIKKYILCLVLFIEAFVAQAQQDAQYTQYIFNGLHINPAYAGHKEETYIQGFDRSQWVGVPGAPKTFALAADGVINDGNVGLGLILTRDIVGAQSGFSGYANYAYRLRLSDDETERLSFGLAAGFVQLGIDGSKLQAVEDNDDVILAANENVKGADARLGVYYANSKWFMGLSATNLLIKSSAGRRAGTFPVPLPQPHIYFTAGTLLPVNDVVTVKPVVLLKDDLKGPASVDINGFVLLGEHVWLGAFYRSSINLFGRSYLQQNLPQQSALGGIAEIFVNEGIRIGYSYDYALNALRNYNSGTHELSVGFYIGRGKNGQSSIYGRDYRPRCYKF